MKEHHTKAYIYVSDSYNIKYLVSTIEQIIYEDESISYIFTPHYSVIDLLSTHFFQGIPGLNLDLRKKTYTRKREVPTFIYERVPQKNREDLWGLLNDVNLDYYNPLEWLIRTDKIYTGDSLSIGPYFEPSNKNIIDEVNPFDKFEISDVKHISKTNFLRLKKLLEIIVKNAYLQAGDFIITDENRKVNYSLIYPLYIQELESRKSLQRVGIIENKVKFKGRKKIKISFPKLVEIMNNYEKNTITKFEAMEKLGIKSPATFYRRLKEFRFMNIKQ